eukprot:GHVP01047652.1.p1 GENE.GHVP01047652.1~~GHVP01047652.1.p1  ORF type:complete len:576 (+),score=120.29 GHVP01047652.1:38-1729(+)
MELESKSFEAEIILQDVFLKTLCSVILSKDILTITSVENPTKQKQFLIATFVGHRSGKSKPKLQFKFLTEDSDVQIELSFVKSETQPDPMLAMGTLINQIKLNVANLASTGKISPGDSNPEESKTLEKEPKEDSSKFLLQKDSVNFIQLRNAALENQPEIAHAYRNLVTTELVREEEFWLPYKNIMLAFGPDKIPDKNTTGFLGMTLNDEKANELQDALLAEDQNIRRRFQQVVPSSMSAAEFWSRFKQSAYYFAMIGKEIPEKVDEIMGSFDINNIVKTKSYKIEKLLENNYEIEHAVSSDLDLLKNVRLWQSGSNLVSNKLSDPLLKRPSESLLNRFNIHSSSVVEHSEGPTIQNESSDKFLQEQNVINDLTGKILPVRTLKRKEIMPDDLKVLRRRIPNEFSQIIEELNEKNFKSNEPVLDTTTAKSLFIANTKLLQREAELENEKTILDSSLDPGMKYDLDSVAQYAAVVKQVVRMYWELEPLTGAEREVEIRRLLPALINLKEEMEQASKTSIDTLKRRIVSSNPILGSKRAFFQPLIQQVAWILEKAAEAIKQSTSI